jgi:hypothetical protein
MKNLQSHKIINPILLLLVPALYMCAGFFFHSERAFYFMQSVDPEYCYLFNGLNISQFTLKVWHVDHPGTPIQLLAAVVIRVVHLFHGNGPLLKDVMQNSALYVNAINITMFSINSIALFFLGRVACKFTKSIIQSMFLQFTPFASFLVLTLIFRINPENMAILSMILMGILILKYLQRNDLPGKIIDKYLLGFAIVAGFTVAVKITFFPVFFIPFFLFKGLVRKIFYSFFSGLAFLIFIVPVIYYRFWYFYDWIKNLFIHSGKYGGGEANVIDKNAYLTALKSTFSFEYFFTVSFFVFILALIIYQIPYIKSKFKNDLYYNVLLGITISMLLMILLVAKQFTFHYLTPALLPISLGIWIVVSIFFSKWKTIYKNIIFIVLILLMLSFDYRKIDEYHPVNISTKEGLMKTYDFIKQNPSDKPIVISSGYYGCPYQQYSLCFGTFWGGEIMKPRYIEVLKEIYPDNYFYNGWDELFHDWEGNAFTYKDLLEKYKSIRFYSGDADVENNILSTVMFNFIRKADTKTNKIFSNETTHENIYEISYEPLVENDTVETTCDADSLDIDKKYFVAKNDQLFKDGITQSSDKSRSGKYASKLTKDAPYGMTYKIGEVRKDEHYEFSVWRHNSNGNASFILAGRDSKDLYIAQKTAIKSENEWEELVIDFIVPENMNNKEISVYGYNDTDIPAYFDDLKIIKY